MASEATKSYFNSLPFSERKKLSPDLNDTRLSTLKACREIEIRRHKSALREIDAWIYNVTPKDKPNE
jgi:hypothetical protein